MVDEDGACSRCCEWARKSGAEISEKVEFRNAPGFGCCGFASAALQPGDVIVKLPPALLLHSSRHLPPSACAMVPAPFPRLLINLLLECLLKLVVRCLLVLRCLGRCI